MRSAIRSAVAACLLVGGAAQAFAAAEPPLLATIFSDHAVLQRDQPIAVWGHAPAGSSVTVTLGEENASAIAAADGRWTATLGPLAAGGPYRLAATTAGRSESASDILIGDVWLCSGQSNMVLEVRRSLDARAEMEGAQNDTIRMLTIGYAASPEPLDDFVRPPRWLATTPATVGDFSAACYYFARELQPHVRVALGLVNASWGGSQITTWMSQPALHAIGGSEDGLALLELKKHDPFAAAQGWGARWETWWNEHRPAGFETAPWSATLSTEDWTPAPPQLGHWDDWGVPALLNHVGMVWYRTSVALTAEQAAEPAVLTLGSMDEIDEAWVNGKAVGDGANDPQSYAMPAGILEPGLNTITVNVFNTYKQGGLLGPAKIVALHLKDGTTVPLTGWKYRIVPSDAAQPPRSPWEEIAGLGMAYDGMIAPLDHNGFRGTVWYQGESDTGDPAPYRARLAGLMADWRSRFGRELPFLVVQLPNYGAPSIMPGESGTAELREAQRQAVAADPHAALTVTIDLGERSDIHPANKQEVGRRLALAARRLVYGETIVASGPTAVAAEREKGAIVVRFANVQGRLVAYNAVAPIGFELCGASPASCRYVRATLDGDQVMLAMPAHFTPTHVRFLWSDSPVTNLFDMASLPAAPFDLPVAGRQTAADRPRAN